jgi:hypothetical protein
MGLEKPPTSSEHSPESSVTKSSNPLTGRQPNPLSIHPVYDDKHSVKLSVDSKGGTLRTTDAKGIRYELAIPKDALELPKTIVMTPVQSADDLPMSGGLQAAVRLQPDGLQFDKEVELTVTLPSANSPAGDQTLTGFAFRGDGEEVHLHPVTPLPGGTQFKVKLFHFSGYGGGNATVSILDGGTFTVLSRANQGFMPCMTKRSGIHLRTALKN